MPNHRLLITHLSLTTARLPYNTDISKSLLNPTTLPQQTLSL